MAWNNNCRINYSQVTELNEHQENKRDKKKMCTLLIYAHKLLTFHESIII